MYYKGPEEEGIIQHVQCSVPSTHYPDSQQIVYVCVCVCVCVYVCVCGCCMMKCLLVPLAELGLPGGNPVLGKDDGCKGLVGHQGVICNAQFNSTLLFFCIS